MDGTSGEDSAPQRRSSRDPDDDFLIAGMLGGDAAALRKLMDRYDRLVRYTVFRATKRRCLKDPHWLESIASDTWAGFVRSMRRDSDEGPRSVAAYLVQIARNQCVTALRRATRSKEPESLDGDSDAEKMSATLDEPAEIVSRMEDLEALRSCMAELNADGRMMVTQLTAITERRWRDAADALGLSESTLRSRWKHVLTSLRRCLLRKTGKSVAPDRFNGDP